MRRDLASPLWESFEELMLTDGRLGRALKQMVATRVSYANACRCCSAAHSGRAKLLGVPEAIVDRLADPLDSLDIEPVSLVLVTCRRRSVKHFSTAPTAFRSRGWRHRIPRRHHIPAHRAIELYERKGNLVSAARARSLQRLTGA